MTRWEWKPTKSADIVGYYWGGCVSGNYTLAPKLCLTPKPNKCFVGPNLVFISIIYIYIRRPLNRFPDFFRMALLLIVHTWNSSSLPNNLLRLQCTCCTFPTTSGTPHGSPLVWSCQWPSSRPLSSPQLSHNDSLWD